MGMVLTLVVVDRRRQRLRRDRGRASDGLARAPVPASSGVILGDGRGAPPRCDAEVGIGDGLGRRDRADPAHGELAKHAESVVLPLLLPDSPVVVWWPADAPDGPGRRPARVGWRSAGSPTRPPSTRRQAAAMRTAVRGLPPGDTDLAWTRLTPWRALLAAALDQYRVPVIAASVDGRADQPRAPTCWRPGWRDRLQGHGRADELAGPGHHRGRHGRPSRGRSRSIRPRRHAGHDSRPRTAPTGRSRCKRRRAAELLAEELRRLDPDEVYADTVATRLLAQRRGCRDRPVPPTHAASHRGPRRRGRPGRRPPPASWSPGSGRPGRAAGPQVGLTGGTHRRGRAPRRSRAIGPSARSTGSRGTSGGATSGSCRRRLRGPQRDAGAARAARPGAARPRPRCTRGRPPTRVGRRRRRRRGGVRRGAGATHGRRVDFDVLMLGHGPRRARRVAVPRATRALRDDRVAVGVTDSPKPPPERVTLTLRRSTAAARCGSWSAARTRPTRSPWPWPRHRPAQIPAAGVRGEVETIWFLDRARRRGCSPADLRTHRVEPSPVPHKFGPGSTLLDCRRSWPSQPAGAVRRRCRRPCARCAAS